MTDGTNKYRDKDLARAAHRGGGKLGLEPRPPTAQPTRAEVCRPWRETGSGKHPELGSVRCSLLLPGLAGKGALIHTPLGQAEHPEPV